MAFLEGDVPVKINRAVQAKNSLRAAFFVACATLFILSVASSARAQTAALHAPFSPTQVRSFPANSYWGVAAFEKPFGFTIGGREFPFAPGAMVRTAGNLLITPNALLGTESRMIRFQVNAHGLASRVWLLTPAEEHQLKSAGR